MPRLTVSAPRKPIRARATAAKKLTQMLRAVAAPATAIVFQNQRG